mgnify:FL=1
MAEVSYEEPFVASVSRMDQRLDPITQQILLGLDGQGGFVPDALRAIDRTFFDPVTGKPIVIGRQIAGLTPDQLEAMRLARAGVGAQEPFFEEALRSARAGIGSLQEGLTAQAEADRRAAQELREGARFALDQRDIGLLEELGGAGRQEARALAAEEGLRRDLIDALGIGTLATQQFSGALSEAENLQRAALADFDPVAATQRFMDPYEQAVVQQTIDDALKGLAQRDMAATARDIQTGGESAFGSRARLSAAERAEALGRGLGQQVGALRSQGFQQAQRTALEEDERPRQTARTGAAGLSGLAAQRQRALSGLGAQVADVGQQRFRAGTGLGQTLGALGQRTAAARRQAGTTGLSIADQIAQQTRNIGRTMAGAGEALGQAQAGFGQTVADLGGRVAQARRTDVGTLGTIGGDIQRQRQAELDAQRETLEKARMAPLAQFQAAKPFIEMVPAGRSDIRTDFTAPPSALQTAIGTGLGVFGGLGSLYGGGGNYAGYTPPASS